MRLRRIIHRVIKEKTPGITIVNPNYMIEINFSTHDGRWFMMESLQVTMVENKEKDTLLSYLMSHSLLARTKMLT
jgi:hypothetical protein